VAPERHKLVLSLTLAPLSRLSANADAPSSKSGGLGKFWSRKDGRPALSHTVSCGALGNGTTYAPGSQPSAAADTEHELTLSRGAATNLASIATSREHNPGRISEANGVLSPDFTAKIVVSGFNIEATSSGSRRSSPLLDPSPNSLSNSHTAAGTAAAGTAGSASFAAAPPGLSVSPRVGSLASQLQPGPSGHPGSSGGSVLDRARSSSLRWSHQEAGLSEAAPGGGHVSEVNLQPFRPGGGVADRLNVDSGSDGCGDEKDGSQGGAK
jgi:hypothetical protein